MKKQKWIQEFSIQKDGFYGHLYHPTKDEFPDKALLVLGGGGMPYQSTLDITEAFIEFGINALAVGYFGVPDAPKTIVRVPVEYIKKATEYLHNQGVKTVIAIGISKGAELALVAASLIPEINSVIALSPPSRVYMGVGSGISWENASSWSFEGKELPYAYAPSSGMHALWNTICARELTFRPVYEEANRLSNNDCMIPVERICGPVLVVASTSDSLWPSAEACHEMIQRLDENNFAYPYKELVYPYASHLMLPFETAYSKLFRVGRKYPKECKQTVYELKDEIIAWFKM